MRYYKGLGVLLDAMARATARVVIVGDGPMEASLREQAARLQLGDKLVFAGAESSCRMRLGAGGGAEQGETQQEEDGGLSHHLRVDWVGVRWVKYKLIKYEKPFRSIFWEEIGTS